MARPRVPLLPRAREKADPAQVCAIQRILGLPITGTLCRPTILAAAIYARSWQRGPGLIPLVLSRHQAMSALIPALLVSIARSQIGTHESGGANKGSALAAYFGADAYRPNSTDDGYPWCASFVCWCVLQAMRSAGIGETATFHRPTTPSAFGFEAWSLAQDSSTQTKKAPGKDIVAGDIVILRHSHIVIATGAVDPATGRFPQVSGNTSVAGSREGTHVLANKTHFTSIRSRIRFKI
jgi:hypothetical protein